MKASVRLRFRNRAGKQMVVQRLVQLSSTRTGLKFNYLDGVIRTLRAEDNQVVSCGYKCSELDRQVPELLGVSAAVLDNVIFCHQEDSNWPLMEPLVLKKKFDDIFESARYTKALVAIKSQSVES